MMNLLTKKEIEEALEYCISQVDKGMRQFHDGYFPRSSSNNCYKTNNKIATIQLDNLIIYFNKDICNKVTNYF